MSATRGRPAGPPASPLGAFIVERLQRRLTRTELAARLRISPSALSRLLSGKTRWTRVTPLAIADALELSDADRAYFSELCALRPLHGRRLDGQSTAPAPRKTAGRPARDAVSAAGKLVEPLLRERGMTRSALAHALGVKESTVTRMMNGKHGCSYAISAQGISDALQLDGVTRRTFLRQALGLGVFALASGQSAPAMLRYRTIDLAAFDADVAGVQRLLDNGRAAEGLARSRELYHTILTAPFPRTHQAAAARRIEAALMLGRAQEATLAWGGERTGAAVQTYNHIDREILSMFPIGHFARYYARVNERRAPHYRELEDYDESIRQFTQAIELFMPFLDDLDLLATLYRNRAHVWAVQGMEREWRRDIDSAARVASRASGAARSRLEGLIMYSEAEGYKRLAGSVPAHNRRRQMAYVQAALSSFTAARAMTQNEGPAHTILLDVSQAQTHVWIDADESARQAWAARERASSIFPSLLRKIDLTIANAAAMGARRA